MRRGGQVSIEYLLITAFSLLLLIPLTALFFVQQDAIRTDLSEAQARTAANTIIEAAERVYFAGPPSTETVRINVPQGVESIEISELSVVFTMQFPQRYDLLVPSQAPLIPTTLSSTQGLVSVRVQAQVGGVSITEQ